jgi:cytoskeletal protein CcmA (bactofilin family)
MSPPMDALPEQNNLYVGEGVAIKGEISVPDTLVVCGSLEGDVSVGNLVIGATGAITGRIVAAQNADISGKIFDKLDVRGLLILRAGSRVDGHISYGMLQIEQGASIAGGLSSAQKLGTRDLLSSQDRKPQKRDAATGGETRNSKQPDLSDVGSINTGHSTS